MYYELNFLNGYDMGNQYDVIGRNLDGENEVLMLKLFTRCIYPKNIADIYCRQIDEAKLYAK
jgi:hypothetical protein